MRDLCDEVDRFCEEKAPPEARPDAALTVATVDNKGIVIRKPHTVQSAPDRAFGDPDKPGKKKMATVIHLCYYTLRPYGGRYGP